MSAAIVAGIGGAIGGALIGAKGSKDAANAAATKDSGSASSGYENQSGTNNVSATLKSLGYTDEQIRELTQSSQQQQSQQATSQLGQTSTAHTGNVSGATAENQASTGSQSTAQQLTDNLSQSSQSSQTQGTVLNQFQAGDTSAARQVFNSTAGGITPEQYQAIVNKAGMDLEGQVPGLTKALATASGTSTANNSGLAIGLQQAKDNALLTAAQQSVAASQNAQQIAAGAAGTIAGATTGNNQTLQQWQQQQQSSSNQQQTQQSTGLQQNVNNTNTTGTNNQTTQDLTNQLANQTGSTVGSNTTTGTTAVDRSNQGTTQQNTNQNQATVSTGNSQYGESSVTDVDSLRAPSVSVDMPTVVRPSGARGGTVAVAEEAFAEGGLISGGGSALPGSAPSRGTIHANGAPGSAAAAQILLADANRKASAVNNAAQVLSKYLSTPMTDKDGKPIKNADGTPVLPAQNLTDALKSSSGIGDFFNRLGSDAYKPPSSTPATPPPAQTTITPNMSSFSLDGFSQGGKISGPGTGTSDSILAVVDGKKPIAVSNGEYVNTAAVVENLGVKFFEDLERNFGNAKI